MNAREIELLRSANSLLYYYPRNEQVRNQVSQTFYYQNRPVFLLIDTLNRFSEHYFEYYNHTFRRSIRNFSDRKTLRLWKDTMPNRILHYLEKCQADSVEFRRLNDTISSGKTADHLYNPDELNRLETADTTGDQRVRLEALSNLIGLIGKVAPRMSLPPPGLTKAQKEEAAQWDYFLKRLEEHPEGATWMTPEKLAELEEQKKIWREKYRVATQQPTKLTIGQKRQLSQYEHFFKELDKQPGQKTTPAQPQTPATVAPATPKKTFTPQEEAAQWDYFFKQLEDATPSTPAQPQVIVSGGQPVSPVPTPPPATTTPPTGPSPSASSGAPTPRQGFRRPNLGSIRKPSLRPNLGSLSKLANLIPQVRAAKYIGIAGLVVMGIFILPIISSYLDSSGFLPRGATAQASYEVKVTKTGPSEVENGANIEYKITVAYGGKGQADIEVTDIVPSNAEFISADSEGQETSGIIKWSVSKLPAGQTKTLSFSVKPTTDDIWVQNTANAKVTKTYNGNQTIGAGCPTQEQINANKTNRQTCQYLNPSVTILDTNFTEEQIQSYINTYQKQSKRSLSDFEERTRYIVQRSIKAGLNPVIALGYWRTESGFGNGFGCPELPLEFDIQLNCALGGNPDIPIGQTALEQGSVGPRCAREADAEKYACRYEASIRRSHPTIYASIPMSIPITTFDDLAEAHGSRAPTLEEYNCKQRGGKNCDGLPNNNCTHTYNLLLEVILATNSCKATSSPNINVGSLAQCNFTKADQTPPSVPYQSQKLLSYFQEAQQKTGFPAVVLASIARVESTTDTYTISNYTDEEVAAMESFDYGNQPLSASNVVTEINRIKGTKVPGSANKDLCPVSSNNALGLMQIQPPGTNGHDSGAVAAGIEIAKRAGILTAEKNVSNLTLNDYCNPKTSIFLSAGFILKKLTYTNVGNSTSYGNGTSWDSSWTNNRTVINEVARRYYGGLLYGDQNQYNYGDDVWNSLNQCK
jgi:hypothetical protein